MYKGCLLVLVSHGSSTKDQNTEAARLRSCTYSFILSDGSLLAVRPMLPGAAAAGLRQYLESSLLACREYNMQGAKERKRGERKEEGENLNRHTRPVIVDCSLRSHCLVHHCRLRYHGQFRHRPHDHSPLFA